MSTRNSLNSYQGKKAFEDEKICLRLLWLTEEKVNMLLLASQCGYNMFINIFLDY